MDISIIISNYKRLDYLKKTLNHIRINAPHEYTWELIVAEEISEETPKINELLKSFSNYIKWKMVLCDPVKYEKETGIKKYYNNPAWTNNCAIWNASGKYIIHQGNEVLATNWIYANLVEEYKKIDNLHTILYSTTYNVPSIIHIELGEYAEKLNASHINYCRQWPLQSASYKSEVTNYISLYPKESAMLLKGYDERYLLGIGADDSCFSRRFRHLPDAKQVWSKQISLHLDHGGVTCYGDAQSNIVKMSKWNEGVRINRELFHSWNGQSYENQQTWEPGKFGIIDILNN